MSETDTERALFVNFDNLPNLPLIIMTTDNLEEPTCEFVSAPNEMCMGESITNNEYVCGEFTLSQKGNADIQARMKIRIRGNTSAYTEKKPYKIVLEKPIDLFQRGDEKFADTDWILIKYNGFETPVGNCASKFCGVEWQPQYKFVNVILNGDWKGDYLLVESIGKGKLNIQDDGFIIEDDAYWWNENGQYFKSYWQIKDQPENGGIAYTYKYPSPNKITDKEVERIKAFIDEFEYVLYTEPSVRTDFKDNEYWEYIDVDSFVAWVLAHDLLGTRDYGGSNIFVYKNDLIKGNEKSSKLKIGPAWDFDSNYLMKDEWANIHLSVWFYYPKLFKDEVFVNEYADKWNEVSATAYQEVMEFLYALRDEQGDDIQKSWTLDAERWHHTARNFEANIERAENWFSSRVEWMNNAVAEMSQIAD